VKRKGKGRENEDRGGRAKGGDTFTLNLWSTSTFVLLMLLCNTCIFTLCNGWKMDRDYNGWNMKGFTTDRI
jgi:hypothetical protein